MIGDLFRLVSLVVGVVLLSAGAWVVAPAAGLIVAGLFLVGVPLLEARGRRLGG